MPTYKNNSKGTIIVENVDGNLVPVAPGESITTNKVISVTGMTQTASTPVYSPVVEIHEVTFTGKGDNQTVELSLGTTKYIQIKKISGILSICILNPRIMIPFTRTSARMTLFGTSTCLTKSARSCLFRIWMEPVSLWSTKNKLACPGVKRRI